MVNNAYILNHLQSINLDIRQTHDGTWIDQKCAFDVVGYVADCILNYVSDCEELGEDNPVFTIKTIWKQDYSRENINIFGKREVDIKDNEYDKFFGQPIKCLNHAGVITIHHKKGNQLFFNVVDMELLEYISNGGQKALNFLQLYIEEVLKASGLYDKYIEFWDKQDKDSYNDVKKDFEDAMIAYTGKGSRGGDPKTECDRIFIKVLNPLAYKYAKKGTESGSISDDIIQQSDLVYNRKNFRDIYTGKPKNVSREEYERTFPREEQDGFARYEIDRAKRAVRRYNRRNNAGLSECIADYSISIDGIDYEIEKFECANRATQVHHIFPKHEYESIAAHLENLIALSPNQHVLYAHPNGNTQEINRLYQYYLLLCKIDRIKNDGNGFYSVEKLQEVLNTGFETEEFNGVDDFDSIINIVKTKY